MDTRIVHTLCAVRRECAQPLTISKLAAQIGLSRSRFEHLFKEQTGEALKPLLRNLRMERAKLLLADFGLSIKEIACECGYSSGSYFVRDFKKVFHLPPSQYRRRTF